MQVYAELAERSMSAQIRRGYRGNHHEIALTQVWFQHVPIVHQCFTFLLKFTREVCSHHPAISKKGYITVDCRHLT